VENARVRSRISKKSSAEVQGSISGWLELRVSMAMSRPGSRYGRLRRAVASTMVKIAVLPPMPEASVPTAIAAKAGFRPRKRLA